jgi:hypothetical protein
MSGLSEINLLNTDTLKTVDVGRATSRPTTPVANTVNKIDIERKAAVPGSPSTDRVVPMDDLNLLMDPTKTKSEDRLGGGLGISSSPSPPTLSIQKPAAAPTTTSMHSFLNETTDLSDILGKKDTKSAADFSFTPSINVSTNATLPTPPRAAVAAPAPVAAAAAANATTTGSAASAAAPAPAANGGLWSSLFGAPAPAPATTAPAATPATTPATPASATATKPLFGATTTPATTTVPAAPAPAPTNAELLREKQDLLFKLNRLRERGMPVSKKYTMSSPLEDIKMEFMSLKAQRDIHNSIKFQRKMMMAVVTGVEFINTKFDPFDVKLDGWSESVHENVNDYDEIFEELHEKHKEKAKMAPETKLFFSLAGSAFMFHLTQSLFKSSTPAMADVMQQNPEMMKQFAQAAVGAQQQQQQMGGGGYGAPMPPQGGGGGMGGGGMGGGMGDLFSGLMGGGGGGGLGGLGGLMGAMGGMGGMGGGSGSDNGSSYGASEVRRQEMSGPKGVDDILSQLSAPPPAPAARAAPPATTSGSGGLSEVDTASLVREISTSIDAKGGGSNQRLASVTKATPSDLQQHGHTMRKMDTASSGYRRKVTDGMKLNI